MCLTTITLNTMFGNTDGMNYIAKPDSSHTDDKNSANNEISVDIHLASTPLRTPHASDNKYSRGVLGVITGSNDYPGAAVLSTSAAIHANIGMVRYSGPLRAQNLVLQASPEVVAYEQLNGKIDAITVGCGIPDESHCNNETALSQRKYIASILAKYSNENKNDNKNDNAETQLNNNLPPICVDAGALDLLPKQVCEKVVLTPHTGELSSLFTRYDLEVSAQQIASNPTHYAQKAANLTGATVLVKGATTAVASPSKLHSPIYIAQYAPSWLATAGSGDVLAGILGALLAQHEKDNENNANNKNYALIAASAAVIHGVCAVFASRSSGGNNYTQLVQDIVKSKRALTLEHPIVASDIINALPHVLGILINIK
ncbi:MULTISPECIES: ADP-dependent NAD(P)H-hydrate dehydratase [Gardnerella]|uniref:ADP-dependent NAD(P)H-hydrate dehydratase n=1 Tax=Gardnerella TaxID=2701 RepID=UPI0009EE0EB8|nr:ADP/ATP-dependent (S)-NAD(P)H-hydrate dehydratase [Gardnerella sp. 26-12]PMC51232.1 NAD(P)H-hydrate dehydratase [Gardnerella vaginalis]PMC53708.1 NAD(P)H-hydrate dehydratase [Gardnerella vaginalis]